jgi:hypothetical protein
VTMEEVAYRLTAALVKVVSNKGAPGLASEIAVVVLPLRLIDGLTPVIGGRSHQRCGPRYRTGARHQRQHWHRGHADVPREHMPLPRLHVPCDFARQRSLTSSACVSVISHLLGAPVVQSGRYPWSAREILSTDARPSPEVACAVFHRRFLALPCETREFFGFVGTQPGNPPDGTIDGPSRSPSLGGRGRLK